MEHLLTNTTKYNVVSNNEYDFLISHNESINCNKIYELINSYFDYQLINIYNFIKIRLLLLRKLISTDFYEIKNYNKITPAIFNSEMKELVNDNIVLGIFIINSIILYHSPR